MSDIRDRIDAALERVALRGMEVRAIYLDPADCEAMVKAHTRFWRKELKSNADFIPLSYRDYPLRHGKTSRIYSTHGVEVTIPKRLSARVKVAA